MSINESFSKIIKERRKQLHLTQEHVAGECSISTRAYQELENGNSLPSLDTLIYLAHAVSLDLDTLAKELRAEKLRQAQQEEATV